MKEYIQKLEQLEQYINSLPREYREKTRIEVFSTIEYLENTIKALEDNANFIIHLNSKED